MVAPTSSKNGAMALARDVMDKALSAPTEARLTFHDAETGSEQRSNAEAHAWRTRIYSARATARRQQAKAVQSPMDIIEDKNGRYTDDPDVVRTSYDNLYVTVERGEACTILRLRRADSTSLPLELL